MSSFFKEIKGKVFSPQTQDLPEADIVELLREVRSLQWNPEYTVLEVEVRSMEDRLKSILHERKKWYEKPIGIVGMGISIAVLGALALVALKIK